MIHTTSSTAASSSAARVPIPTHDEGSSDRVTPPTPPTTPIFSTVQSTSDPEQWSPGDVAILQIKKPKGLWRLGLIFETPLQHDYETGVEVRSLLSAEVMEEVDGRMAVTDVDPNGQRRVKFWIADLPSSPRENML